MQKTQLLKQNHHPKPQIPDETWRSKRGHGKKRTRRTHNLGQSLPTHRRRQMVRTTTRRRKRTHRKRKSRNPPKPIPHIRKNGQKPIRRTQHKQTNTIRNLQTRNEITQNALLGCGVWRLKFGGERESVQKGGLSPNHSTQPFT